MQKHGDSTLGRRPHQDEGRDWSDVTAKQEITRIHGLKTTRS